MHCNAEFYYVGKILPVGIGLQRRVVSKWFQVHRCSDALFYIHREPVVCLTLDLILEHRRSKCLPALLYSLKRVLCENPISVR